MIEFGMRKMTHLEKKIPQKVINLAQKFWKKGGKIYLVGGAVRDLMVGRKIYDWDFTTDLTPEQMLKLGARAFYENKFGTVSFLDQKGKPHLEVTTFRSEEGYTDKRRPDKVVWGKKIEEDLSRRDFTINAMALELKKSKKGLEVELVDPFWGEEDLKNRVLRAVGEPEKRFEEDALRLLRAIRIATQIGLTIEKETFKAIFEKSKLLAEISAERIRDEFFKLLVSDHPGDGIKLLYSSGLLNQILPELTRGYGLAQAKHHIYDVWNHSINALDECESTDPITRLATLIHDIGKPVVVRGEGEERSFHNHEVAGGAFARKLAQRLKLSKKQADKLYRLVRWHQFTCEEKQTDKAIRRFIKNVTPEYLEDIIALRRADRLGSGAKETSWRWELFKKRLVEVQKQPFSIKDLKVDGADVMKILKMKPGPKVGQVLKKLFAEVEKDKDKNTRAYLLKRIKELG
jgi:tRNA nucleotidyltransferase (CCA-adding enzyme)